MKRALHMFVLTLALVPSSAFAQGWAPTPRGGGSGSGACASGDLSSGCYVKSISGANGAGGTVNVAADLAFDAATVAPTLTQTAPSSDVATTSLSILSQPAYASASTNKSAGSLILDTGASVSGGSSTVYLGALTASTGNATSVQVGGSGGNVGSVDIYASGGSELTTLGVHNTSLSTSSAGFYQGSILEAVLGYYGTNNELRFNGYGGGSGIPTNFYFDSQKTFSLTEASSHSQVGFFDNGTQMAQLAPNLADGANYITLWLGNATPTSTNYFAMDDGAQVFLNSGNEFFFQIDGTALVDIQNGVGIFPQTAGALTSGTSSAYWLTEYSEAFDFPASLGASGYIQFSGAVSSGNGQNLVVHAEDTTATSGNGGEVDLYTGAGGSSGTSGDLRVGFGGSSPPTQDQLAWSLSSTAITEQQLTAASGTNPDNLVFEPQGPNGLSTTQATNTPGSFIVALAHPGTDTVTGLNGSFQLTDSGTLQFEVGNGGAVSGGSTAGADIWLTPGIFPSTSNYLVQASTSVVELNAPASAGLNLQIGGTSYANFNTGAFALAPPLDGYSSTQPLGMVPVDLSISAGGTITPSTIHPVFHLTGTMSAATTIVLPNADGFYIFDLTSVAGGISGTDTLAWKCGTSSASSSMNSSPKTSMAIVNCRVGNNVPAVLFN